MAQLQQFERVVLAIRYRKQVEQYQIADQAQE